ncbi:hypothetical protein [Phycicoccus jejuensis]|uniref:hypothetical protein n=1 Tax=Phycicoccus jejuensis TaxID=367299 RepID=UPI0004C3CAFD|nr:hypothetical protein [Phycicoccus jejuensis]
MPPDDLSPDVAASAFEPLLAKACSKVKRPWMLMPVSDEHGRRVKEVYRERVYCYELYHQLRTLCDGADPMAVRAGAPYYSLGGEIDKQGLHAVTKDGRHQPDLVWHVPGTDENAVVVEVKIASTITKRGLEKDLLTLAAFCSRERTAYQQGWLLFVGWERSDDSLLALIHRAAASLRDELASVPAGYLRAFRHEDVGKPARELAVELFR